LKNILNKIAYKIRSKLIDQWQYSYLEYNLDSFFTALPKLDETIEIRLAKISDIDAIKKDLFLEIPDDIENDKKYFSQLGDDNFNCYIAIKDHKVIHYFQFYYAAIQSPLIKTPYGKKIIKKNDSYLGSTFTTKEFRSLWIVPHSINLILENLKTKESVKRALVVVHKDTAGAENFYKRLGFSVIDNASPKNLFEAWFKYLLP